MLKACSLCGKIHDKKYICEPKQKQIAKYKNLYKKKNTKNSFFRNSAKWKAKSNAIRNADKNLCLVCLNNGRYVPGTEVHHIVSLKKDYEKRLDDDNLITLCHGCHELAESNILSEEFLEGLVKLYRD